MDTYEKKYKEIVGKIRKAYLYAQTDSTKAVLKEIFPELAEGEGEKVRKELIKHLKEGAEGYEPAGDSSDYQRWLDWLEKQGEHANFLSKIQVGDKVTRNEDGVLVNLSQLNRVAKKNEKQCEQKFEMKTAEESLGIDSNTYNKIVDECLFGEQKPADTVEPKFKVGDKIHLKPEYRMPSDDTPIANTVKEIIRIDDKHYRFDGSYIFIEDQDKYELAEQKTEENKGNIGGISPKWSVEDKAHIESILERLEGMCKKGATFTATRFAVSQDIDWLNSLKDRVQPKQEWSEEDKVGLGDALWAIKQARTIAKDENDMGNLWYAEHWLKSLRLQSRWKPSELQLECLSDAIEHYNSLGYPASKLKELLDDLKKIKEGNV